jgi:hypothetical protein
MSSSPSDLAVTYRSIPRRLRSALGDTPARTCADAARIDELIADAAIMLRCPAEAHAVADAIEARPADEWADGELERLTAGTMEAGRLLRDIDAARPRTDEEDDDYY